MSKTIPITSPTHFSTLLASSRIVVVDFWAPWCGPCKAVAPVYEALSTQLSRPNTLTFTKVNTDEQKQIASTYNISSIPTFMIFKAGRATKTIRGANMKELDAAVKQLAQEAGSAGNGEGSSAGESSGGFWIGASLPRGYTDVTDAVDQRGLDFLNLDSDAGAAKIVFDTSKPGALSKAKTNEGEGKKDWIESDTDAQLMLYIPFQSTMKLHTLHITSLPSTSTSRPKTIKLYTNRSHVLGFDEAEDEPATQTLDISASDWDDSTGTAKVELRFVKFQNISSVVVFVVDNEEDEEKTRIDRLRLVGETGEKKGMGKLEKVGDEQGE